MAITKETIRTLVKEGQETLGEVELYDRPYEFEENGRYVLVGVRQAGKSYMLYKRAKQLLASGHSLEEMVYIDFDDERLLGMTATDLDQILQAYGSVYSHKPILFSMRFRISKAGSILPVAWLIRNINCLLRAAMPRC